MPLTMSSTPSLKASAHPIAFTLGLAVSPLKHLLPLCLTPAAATLWRERPESPIPFFPHAPVAVTPCAGACRSTSSRLGSTRAACTAGGGSVLYTDPCCQRQVVVVAFVGGGHDEAVVQVTLHDLERHVQTRGVGVIFGPRLEHAMARAGVSSAGACGASEGHPKRCEPCQ
eukprot:scaffold7449_cov19-Tisochrysis_lutea.AAC.3